MPTKNDYVATLFIFIYIIYRLLQKGNTEYNYLAVVV